MKIGIYNPYLNILGGGERYTFDIADFFLKRGDGVDFFWEDKSLKEEIKSRYGLELDRVNFLPNIFLRKLNLLKKFIFLHGYDIFFYVTDGSLFTSPAKKNILIIQSPIHIPKKTIFNKIKIRNWNFVLCYSEFVKKYILKSWKVNVVVLPPAIEVNQFKPLKKENLIISVGRFTQSLHSKKQEILIKAFKKLTKSLPSLKLILTGGLLKEDQDYFDILKESARGYNIDFFPNTSFKNLKGFYGKAKVYWHAAGFDEDLEKYPEKAEHFGITTVEAMAAGCIPIVYKAGGQLEIIDDKKNGFFWQTEKELISITLEVIKNYDSYKTITENAIKRSKGFSKEVFEKNLKEILCL